MATLQSFYGKDDGPHQFTLVKGAKIFAGWVITDTHLFLLWDISTGARRELIKLSENNGLAAMLLSGEVRAFHKRHHPFERTAIRAVWVERNSSITVYSEDDERELTLGSSSEEVGRRIATVVLPDHEVNEAHARATTSLLARKPKVSPGAWLLFRAPGYTTDRFPEAAASY